MKPRQGQRNVSCLSDLLVFVHRHDLTLEVGLVSLGALSGVGQFDGHLIIWLSIIWS